MDKPTATSWVWEYFLKSSDGAKGIKCSTKLKNGRSTSPLIKHLRSQHAITENSSRASSSEQGRHTKSNDPFSLCEEEEQFIENFEERPLKKKKQLHLESFLSWKHTLRSEALCLVCESNMSMNQLVNSKPMRRLFSRAYPSDPQLPKSGTTITKWLNEDAEVVRVQLRVKLQGIRATGRKLSISFDEATVAGTDRYLSLNVHHDSPILGDSNVAALGLVRVKSRATGSYLSELIIERLANIGLSTNDIVAAATDGATNVLRAVDLMGLKKQKCFAHGLDLVVKKVVYGKEALAYDFDVGILDDPENDETGHESSSDDETDSDSEEESRAQENDRRGKRVVLGEAVDRLRRTVRDFKKKPNLMDEIREMTAKEEFNGVELRPILDCRTRWYSTLLMIERALRIRRALYNVLCRHGTPLSGKDEQALEAIASVLAPFKRAILLLCKKEATLMHADKIFMLLLEALGTLESALARILIRTLKDELKKRRTILSTIIAILDDPCYNFELESKIGQETPSDDDVLEVLAQILDASNEVRSESSPEPMNSSVTLSWDTVFTQPPVPPSNTRSCKHEDLRVEFTLFRAGQGHGRLLKLCRGVLGTIPPTSVQPERDFSILRLTLGENRLRIKPQTLDSIFVLRKSMESGNSLTG